MTLYVVRHQHDADTCPARDPNMGQMLLDHISRENARQYGIDIQADAVIDGEHTFVLIMDAPERSTVEQFMTPFSQAGPVEIKEASECETVVERAGC
jgi:uncharacterized protein YmfQ (DUF2313 family)